MHFKKTDIYTILLKIAAIVFAMNTMSGILFAYLSPVPATSGILLDFLDSIVITLTATPLIALFVIYPYIAAQAESDERYALAIKAANNGLWDWDIVNNTFFFSEQFLSTLGVTNPELDKIEPWIKLIHPEDRERFKYELENSIASNQNGMFQCEYRIQQARGHYIWVLNRWLCVKKNEFTVRAIGAQTDLTALKKAEEKWVYETSYDNLTHLPNRRLMLEKIEEAMRQQHLGEIKGFIFLYIDLDNFKRINDSIGHFAGDELLVKIAERLKKTLRPKDIIARLGGDEFGVILYSVDNDQEAHFVVERLIKNISETLIVTGYTVSPSLSVGVLSVSQGSEHVSAEEVLRDADLALNCAKASGKGRFSFFSSEMRRDIVQEFEISHSLKQAIENHEFSLFYQPIVDTHTLKVQGFEALIRWISPERGIIYPDSFIPIAEESDLIFDLGRFCIRSACEQLKNWMDVFPEERHLFMTINLSGKQILDPFLIYELKQCIQNYKLNPASIHIELTENVLITNKLEVQKIIEKLKNFGFKLSIDDFGTGYSSLNTLGQFPFDVLKIDRSFIKDITTNSKNRDMVSMIISLGEAIGFYVVIEGVETMEQYSVIKTLNPAYLQGYLFSQPLPSDVLNERLSKSFNPQQWM
jgi:diguanylate cyclase (GGDEF)-like protein/PAS domain S-box-containing protein